MKISEIKEFLVLAKNLNYSRSADELFMAQSILTRHIQQIESEFGVKLFVRSTHGVMLTDEGKIAMDELTEIADKYDLLAERLSSLSEGFEGNLRIGILYYMYEDYMESVIGSFEKKHPGINVSIISYQPPSLSRDLIAKKIDVGLMHRVSLPDTSDLQIIDINREPMIIMVPESHRLYGRSKVSVSELTEDTFVFMKSEQWHEPYVKKLLGMHGLNEIKMIYTEQIDTLVNTIISNNAVTVVAGHIASMHRKRISYATFKEKPFDMTISFAYRKDNDNPSLEVFAAHNDPSCGV